MATSEVKLPEGFVLDKAPALPAGFVLDEADELPDFETAYEALGEPSEEFPAFEKETGPGGTPLIKGDPGPMMGRVLKEHEIRAQPAIFSERAPVTAASETAAAYKDRQKERFSIEDAPAEEFQKNYSNIPQAMGFTLGRPQDMKDVVKSAFGDRAELKFHDGLGDYVIQFDDGRMVPFETGALWGQIKGMRAGAGVMAAETGAGLTGLLGGPVAAAAAIPVGTFVGELARLQEGQRHGWMKDLSKEQIIGEALTSAAITAGAEVTLGAGGIILRRMMKSPQAKLLLEDISEEEMENAVQYAAAKQAEIKAATGEEVRLTAGQALTGAGEEVAGRKVQGLEAGLGAFGEDIAQVPRQQLAEAEAALKQRAMGDVPPDLEGAVDVGADIQRGVERQVAEKAERIAQQSIEEQAEALQRQLDIIGDIPEGMPAQNVRDWAAGARRQVFDALSEQYQRISGSLPEDFTINLTGLRDLASKWKGRLQEDIFQTLTDEDKKVVADALTAGLREVEGEAVDVGVGFESLSRAISALKRELRAPEMGPGGARARDARMLNDFVDELMTARDDALAKVSPDLRNRLNMLDASYAQAKEKIDSSLINRLISKKKGGGYKVSDDKFFEAILREPTEAQNIANLIADPAYEGFGSMKTIKDGIMDLYRRKVLTEEATSGAHDVFMRSFRPALERIFSPKEMKRFDGLEKARDQIKMAQKREKNAITEINRSPEIKLTSLDPEEIIDKIKGKPTAARRVMSVLKGDPEAIDQFKMVRARQLLNDIEDTDGNIIAGEIDDLLRSEKGELKVVFGDQFPADLKLLSDIANLKRVPKSIQSRLADITREAPPQNTIAAGWRVIARPLSRLGLVTTSARKLASGHTRKALAKMLADPEQLAKAMKLYRKNAKWDRWRSFFKNLGVAELAHFIEDDENWK